MSLAVARQDITRADSFLAAEHHTINPPHSCDTTTEGFPGRLIRGGCCGMKKRVQIMNPAMLNKKSFQMENGMGKGKHSRRYILIYFSSRYCFVLCNANKTIRYRFHSVLLGSVPCMNHQNQPLCMFLSKFNLNYYITNIFTIQRYLYQMRFCFSVFCCFTGSPARETMLMVFRDSFCSPSARQQAAGEASGETATASRKSW